MFTPTWGDDPIWLICFKGVETTKQLWIMGGWEEGRKGSGSDQWFSYIIGGDFISYSQMNIIKIYKDGDFEIHRHLIIDPSYRIHGTGIFTYI